MNWNMYCIAMIIQLVICGCGIYIDYKGNVKKKWNHNISRCIQKKKKENSQTKQFLYFF